MRHWIINWYRSVAFSRISDFILVVKISDRSGLLGLISMKLLQKRSRTETNKTNFIALLFPADSRRLKCDSIEGGNRLWMTTLQQTLGTHKIINPEMNTDQLLKYVYCLKVLLTWLNISTNEGITTQWGWLPNVYSLGGKLVVECKIDGPELIFV